MGGATLPARQARVGAGVAAGLLVVLAIASTFPVAMPAHHYVAVPVAMALVCAAWIGELAVPRWPRPVLVAAVVATQVWLAALGHIGTNLLLLLLLTAWLGYHGSRAEGLAGATLSLGTIAFAGYVDSVIVGRVAWYGWLSWCVVVVASWVVGRILGRQERLLGELRGLRAAAEQRAREQATLRASARTLASTLELEPLVGALLDQLKDAVDYTAASVRLLERDELLLLAYRGPNPNAWQRARGPISHSPLNRDVVRRRETVVVPNVLTDESDLARAYREEVGERLRTELWYMRSYLGVPLMVRDNVIGLVVLNHETPGHYTDDVARLADAFADHAAVAVDNARLYAQAQTRTRELSTLLTASRSVASTLEQEPLMQRLLDDLKGVVDYSAVSVRLLLDGDLVLLAYRGAQPEAHWARSRTPMDESPAVREGVRRRAPFTIRDFTQDEPELLGEFRRARAADLAPLREQMRAWLGVPLIVRDEVLGAIVLSHATSGFYTPHHAELALAFANHAAVAIQNARLYAQAQQTAGLEERQKLARELHDSVSQALYGIALGARTARTLLDRDPERAKEPVEYVLQLAEAGIAEMRALIFELRPESLQQEGLVAALQKHAASLRARYQVEVEADLGDEPDVPLSMKEGLYRVAQEALHNTVKHAQARRVTLRLRVDEGTLALAVSDDGVGFDAGDEFPGHLGLKSMRERTERLGGDLTIESAPGKGTSIGVRVPVAPAVATR